MLRKLGVTVAATGAVLWGKTQLALRLKRKPEGWRRTLGVCLREEPAKFILSALGLESPADPVVALAEFLRSEPAAKYRLNVARRIVTREAVPIGELVRLDYSPAGELLAVEPQWDGATETGSVLAAFNASRHSPELTRPLELAKLIRDRRLLEAHSVTVQPAPAGDERFRAPDFLACRSLGWGPFHFVLRTHPDGTVDVWVQVHHTAHDGLAVQEMLDRLRAAWGSVPVTFPKAGTVFTPRLASTPDHPREVWETHGFFDFRPLLDARKRLGATTGEEWTVGAALVWELAKEKGFADARIASTVDVPAGDGQERDADFVALRPADFANPAAFMRAFTANVKASRRRASPVRQGLRDLALMPPGIHRAMTELHANRMREAVGSVGTSLVKSAEVVIAPLSDFGFPDGFLAFGNLRLPSADGPVGCASMKGTKSQAERFGPLLGGLLRRLAAENGGAMPTNENAARPTGAAEPVAA